MATRVNNYFNNPAIGQAFSNLASVFAPPSSGDEYNYARAAATRAQEERLADTWANMDTLDRDAIDRRGILLDLFDPTNSYYSVDTSAATTRRGQDVAAATTRRGQDMDLAQAYATNNLTGEQAIPGLPAEVAAALGVGFELPAVTGTEIGAPRRPLTEAEVAGSDRLRLQESGMLTDEMLLAEVMGTTPVENVMGPDGPVIAYRTDAVGQEPFINPGSAPAAQLRTYRTPDGQTGTAVFNPGSGDLRDQATGEPLPQGTITGEINDTASGLTGAQESRFQAQGAALAGALDTIGQLETLIAAAPASQGAVGFLRGTAQNVMQTGNELGRFFGGTMAEVSDAVNSGMLDAGLANEMFDPNIPAIEMLTNVLAWQYAKSFAGDRVSNEQLRIARDAIGGSGMFNNQANSLARLGQLRDMFTREAQRISPTLPPEIAAMVAPYMAATGGAANPGAAPAPAQRLRFNPETGEFEEVQQ